MRARAALVLFGLILVGSACAEKVAPSVTASTPKFPAFVQPPVPAELSASKAVQPYELGWNLLQAGDLRTAARAFASSLQAVPTFYPAEAASGYLELAQKDAAAALLSFDRALAHRADYASALVGKGQALADLNRNAEAAVAFEAALAADPTLVDLRNRIDVLTVRSLERSLADAREASRANRNEEAIALYQAAIIRSPDSAFLYRELGIVERRAGNVDAALGHFRQATTLDANDAASFVQLGDLLEARTDLEGAAAAYGSALAIESNAGIAAKRDAVASRIALARLPEEYRRIPEAPQISRAALAALVAIRLGPLLQTAQSGDSAVMTDVRSTWAEPWIIAVARAGVMEPYENHTFQPTAPVRRIDLAQVADHLLKRIAPLNPTEARAWQNATGRFSDIGPGNLNYPAASATMAAGVMSRGAGEAFEPARLVTGAEATSAVRRLEQLARLPTPASR